MSSREKILGAVKKNQPDISPLPQVSVNHVTYADPVEKFTSILQGIGGTIIRVEDFAEIDAYIIGSFDNTLRIVNTISELSSKFPVSLFKGDPHSLENVELAILQGRLGVAENGAIWITDADMSDRAMPFICQHLALIITRKDIVHTLHEAYTFIGLSEYNTGVFIAGPSKTADIEQSLVLGAHGPKSLTVFILK
jgi:L-lactate dehydrogenase complex protein LldG